MEQAVKSLCKRKAEGTYGISSEMLKYEGEDMIQEVTSMFDIFLDEERVRVEWKKAIVNSLFRDKGSRLDCDNHWLISLIPVSSKAFL